MSAKKPLVPPKAVMPGSKQAARKLDRMSRKYDAAVESLRGNLEVVGECLPELLATAVKRELRSRFAALAEDGVLHDLQTLATALEVIPPDELPPSLSGVERYAHLAVSQLMRAFEVQPVCQIGEELMIQENQQGKFDWSADSSDTRTFPLQATVLKCGWKSGSEILVKPKITRTNS